jgi:hypothetical protein
MPDTKKATINWNYSGKFNFIGTGATKEENYLAYAGSFIIPAFLLYLYFSDTVQWNLIILIIALAIGFDLSGGIVANAMNCCKRFYHTPMQEGDPKYASILKNKMAFSALHIHPIIIWAVYDNLNFITGIVWYAFLIVSAYVVYRVPLYLERGVSMLLVLVFLMVNIYILPAPAGFEWFIPVLFLKIVYGHMVKEEPYRPVNT